MNFKNIFLTVLIVNLIFSCKDKALLEEKGFTTIHGIYEAPNIDKIELSKIEYGKKFTVATANLNAENEYGFAIKPENEAFYMLGVKGTEYPVYIKGSQALEINYTAKEGFDMPTPSDEENQVVLNWFKSNDTLNAFNYTRLEANTYENFFPFYEKFIPSMKAHHKNVNTKNTYFNKLMHAYIDLNIESVATSFIFTPRTKHPKTEDMAPFYKDFMTGDNFKTTNVLNIPKGLKALRSHQMYYAMHHMDSIDMKKLYKVMVNTVENDTLRGLFALEQLHRFKAYNEEYLDFIEPVRKDVALTDYGTKTLDDYEVKIKTMATGSPGYAFTYNDVNDKPVSFSDLKGKVVYIDVWAMWCAPCKQQIPYIKQLEKELDGKGVQFVSISMDKPKELKKWKKFVKDKQLTGIQLFSDDAFNTRIAKDYKINAIPRFLLFDKEGKIIDANAKRPSDPELKKQLLNLLK